MAQSDKKDSAENTQPEHDSNAETANHNDHAEPPDLTNTTDHSVDNGIKNTNNPDNLNNRDQPEQSESDSSVEVPTHRTRKRKTTTNYVESDTASTNNFRLQSTQETDKNLNTLKFPSASRIAARNRPTQKLSTSTKSSIRTHSTDNVDVCTSDDNEHTEDDSGGDDTGSETNKSRSGSETSTGPKSGKPGKFNTTTHGRPIRKCSRKFYCTGCDQVEPSLADLNKHFRNTHPRVRCRTCGRPFDTPSSLRKHNYIRTTMQHACDKCNKAYTFVSQLASHKISHRTHGTHQCIHCKI